MFKVFVTPEMGRGLYSTRSIDKGETITLCEILVLSPEDTVTVNTTDLKYYTFVYNEKQDCLVLGNGEIFNHADIPNVSFELVDVGDRKMMQFKALEFILNGEQLFINYNQDTDVSVQDYITQKSLVG